MTVDTDARRWVLLHGTPLTPAVFAAVAARLPGQVFVPDCTAIPAGAYPQAALAAMIASSIEGPIDVVGHSFGGQTALELAFLVPARIRSLTILCSRDTPFPAFAATAAAMRAGTVPGVEATLARWLSPAELAAGGPEVASVRQQLTAASVPDWAEALDAISAYDASARTPSLRMPVQLIAAGADAVATPAAMAELQGRIPGATLNVHPEWHHLSPFLDPEALAARLTGFAGGTSCGAAPTRDV